MAIYNSEISSCYLFRDAVLFVQVMKRVVSKWTALSVIGTILISVLQLYHSHGLFSWYIIFIMKAKSDSIRKGRDKKSLTVSRFQVQIGENTLQVLGINNETEKENTFFS